MRGLKESCLFCAFYHWGLIDDILGHRRTVPNTTSKMCIKISPALAIDWRHIHLSELLLLKTELFLLFYTFICPMESIIIMLRAEGYISLVTLDICLCREWSKNKLRKGNCIDEYFHWKTAQDISHARPENTSDTDTMPRLVLVMHLRYKDIKACAMPSIFRIFTTDGARYAARIVELLSKYAVLAEVGHWPR